MVNSLLFPWPLKFSLSSFRTTRNVFQATLTFWTLYGAFFRFPADESKMRAFGREGLVLVLADVLSCRRACALVRCLPCARGRREAAVYHNSRLWQVPVYSRQQSTTVDHVKVWNVNMAENKTGGRKVLIAIDGSEHGDRAFDCKFISR